jgi:hypothetical protein
MTESRQVNVATVPGDAVKNALQGRFEPLMVVTGDHDHPVESTLFH